MSLSLKIDTSSKIKKAGAESPRLKCEILKEWTDMVESLGKSKNMLTLSQLKPGESATIRKIKAVGSLKRKFLSMGLVPGEVVKVERVAPLGDPIDVTIKGYQLSLRKEEADSILVERGGDSS
jgi:Fe2+ transport system protein FeoA